MTLLKWRSPVYDGQLSIVQLNHPFLLNSTQTTDLADWQMCEKSRLSPDPRPEEVHQSSKNFQFISKTLSARPSLRAVRVILEAYLKSII